MGRGHSNGVHQSRSDFRARLVVIGDGEGDRFAWTENARTYVEGQVGGRGNERQGEWLGKTGREESQRDLGSGTRQHKPSRGRG